MGLAQSVRHRPAASGLALVVSLAAVFAVAALGGLATATGTGSWYQSIDKPSWNPPNAVFGPVWTVLYVAMAVAAWLVAREGLDRREVRIALGAYAVQLLLNLAWSVVFFGLEAPAAGLAVIAALLVAIVVTMVLFWRIVAPAGWLFVPYLAWVSFAASLNIAIVVLN
jgi:tryptophan-rich sensory protein